MLLTVMGVEPEGGEVLALHCASSPRAVSVYSGGLTFSERFGGVLDERFLGVDRCDGRRPNGGYERSESICV